MHKVWHKNFQGKPLIMDFNKLKMITIYVDKPYVVGYGEHAEVINFEGVKFLAVYEETKLKRMFNLFQVKVIEF